MNTPLVIDSHLDIAWNALSWNREQTLDIGALRETESGMTDDPAREHVTVTLGEMKKANMATCLATILAWAKDEKQPPEGYQRHQLNFASPNIAHAVGVGQLAYYQLLETQGHMKFLRSAADLNRHWQACEQQGVESQPLGIILAMEGADPIVDPSYAPFWFDAGLRVASLAHFGHGRYASGTGSVGPVTDTGLKLLQQFDQLGMILDLTHLCDQSWYQAVDNFSGPILASHNNCRALVDFDRQFTDEQIKIIIDRGGVIGCVIHCWMLVPDFKDGSSNEGIYLTQVADHIDHICQLAGNTRHAGIGSDLDGGYGYEKTPCDFKSIADVQNFTDIFAKRGYSETDIENVMGRNWLRFLTENLPQ